MWVHDIHDLIRGADSNTMKECNKQDVILHPGEVMNESPSHERNVTTETKSWHIFRKGSMDIVS